MAVSGRFVATVTVALIFVAVVQGRPWGAGRGGGARGSGCAGRHGGPFGGVWANLTDAQREQVRNLTHAFFAPNSTLTKDQAKAQMEQFKSTLSPELQSQIGQLEQQHPSPPTPANLSLEAQNFLNQLKSIHDDGSLTFAQERQKVQEAFATANQTVLNEISGGRGGQGGAFGGRHRGFDGPGGRGRGSGGRRGGGMGVMPPPVAFPFDLVFQQLTTEQRREIMNISSSVFSPTSTVTKEQSKVLFDNFKNSLSPELQNIVNENMLDPSPPPVPANISAEAQNFLTQLNAIRADGSITFPQEHQKLKDLFNSTDPNVVREAFSTMQNSASMPTQFPRGNGRFPGGNGQPAMPFGTTGADNASGFNGAFNGGFGNGGFPQNGGFSPSSGFSQNGGFGAGGFSQNGGFPQNGGNRFGSGGRFGKRGHNGFGGSQGGPMSMSFATGFDQGANSFNFDC